jgi:hypothetical protein
MIAVYAPRSLNDPVGWSDSGLTSSGSSLATGISGVRTATRSKPRAASRISARPTSPDPAVLNASPSGHREPVLYY